MFVLFPLVQLQYVQVKKQNEFTYDENSCKVILNFSNISKLGKGRYQIHRMDSIATTQPEDVKRQTAYFIIQISKFLLFNFETHW